MYFEHIQHHLQGSTINAQRLEAYVRYSITDSDDNVTETYGNFPID